MAIQGDPGGSGSVAGAGEGGSTRRSILLHPVVLAVYAVALFALGFLAYLFSSEGAGDTDSAGPVPVTAAAGAVAAAVTSSTAPEVSDPSVLEPTGTSLSTPDGAYVEAVLDLDAGPAPGLFTLRGRVPDEDTAAKLNLAAQISYFPFVSSELEVDPSLPAEPWMEVAPRLVGLLPSISDGTLQVSSDGIGLVGRSADQESVETFVGYLESLGGGLPVEVHEMEITGLAAPSLALDVEDGTVAMSGELSSPEMVELLDEAAIELYGADNVSNDITVGEGIYDAFWIMAFPSVMQELAPFPSYEISVARGVTTGEIQGGINFDIDSTEIGPAAADALNLGVAVLSRDLSLEATFTGHTDDSGPADYNQELSLARAESVIDFLVEAGIDRNRLSAVGAGESEPIADNDTDEGQAMNRRVEFAFRPTDTTG